MLNVFNSKKGTTSIVTFELEHNANCNLNFKHFERITVGMRIGDINQIDV